MRKIYRIENLDCANCAAKIEAKFNALPEVEEAVITFATRQLRLTAGDPDALIEKLQAVARTVESGVVILPRKDHSHKHSPEHCGQGTHEACQCGHHHDHAEGCGCGHHHDGEHHECCGGHCHGHEGEESCGCSHHHKNKNTDHEKNELSSIFTGGILFAAGILFSAMDWRFPSILAFFSAYLLLGAGVLANAVKNLVKGRVFDENFLMGIATIGAFCIGEFPEAVGIMLFYRLGEYIEHHAVTRSRSQIMEAADLRPETVNLVQEGEITVIPAFRAKPGDLLLVRPGDRIPLDGTVVSGESRLDTSPITGEPVPAAVAPGKSVMSGCVNLGSPLTIRADKPLAESMVSRILSSVENAAASKPKIDRFITRFARIYTPVVVALALLTAVVPSLITGEWGYWVYTALSFLVMSCPCALVLSVPLAFFSGIGRGSRNGILFKGGLSMEALARVKAVVMDKTGTLTQGDFTVQAVSGEDTLLLCASCEQYSTHPIAVSILSAANKEKLQLLQPENLEEIPGHGIRAKVAGKHVLCGNGKLLSAAGVTVPALPETDATLVLLSVDGTYRGCITISDTLKTGARQAVERLHAMGITTAMLTGDREESARSIGTQLGIRKVFARLLPEDKLTKLREIRESCGPTMFVGDGINDAPVLSGADVGAAMGSGADAAIEAADVVFMTSSPHAIPEAVDIARQTQRIAWQNVIFALAVKFVVMALGLLGYASMWLAVFADSGVAMLCVLNSIRALYFSK